MVTLMGGYTRNMRQVEGTDKWWGSGSSTRGKEQELLIVRQVEANEQERENVDDGDTPRGVLDCTGYHLARVGNLRRGKTDEFSTSKGTSGGDEDGADTLKAVGKHAAGSYKYFVLM
jgi:hypothetical protein